MTTKNVSASFSKVIEWARANPILAGVLLIGTLALAYLASKKMDGLTAVPTRVVDDAAGAGILGGDEEVLPPLVLYPDGGNGYVEPPTYTWVDDVVENLILPIVEPILGGIQPYYAPEWEMPHRQPLDTTETYYAPSGLGIYSPPEEIIHRQIETETYYAPQVEPFLEGAVVGSTVGAIPGAIVTALQTSPEPIVHRQVSTPVYYAPAPAPIIIHGMGGVSEH